MTCDEMLDRAIPYLDGKLTAADHAGAEAHLDTCFSCRERVLGVSEVVGLLDNWSGMEPSPQFTERLQYRVAQERDAGYGMVRWFQRLVSLPVSNPAFATALLAIVVLAAVLARYSPSSAPVVAQTAQIEQPEVVAVAAPVVDEVALYKNLPVLEDWEVVQNFEVLQELKSTQR